MKHSLERRGWNFWRQISRPLFFAALIALIFSVPARSASKTGMSQTPALAAGGPNTVLATVGDHAVTQGEVDSKVASQLYDLRKQALDDVIDDYLLQQAAKKAGLKPDQYIDRQVRMIAPRVDAREAEQFYNEHKAKLDEQTGGRSFNDIKPRLIAALQRQRDEAAQQELLRKLRAESHVSVLLEAPHVSIASTGHPVNGSSSASVTIIEFSDFQCPFCRAAESSLKQVRDKYGDRVKLVYMDFPLGFHPHAMDAARAARCAADQNKFWQFHDALFQDQKKLDPDNLRQTAARVGLNPTKFGACFSSERHDAGIRQDIAEGNSLGVTGTPTFFINGRQLVGAQPPPKFNEVIDEELAHAKSTANSHQGDQMGANANRHAAD
jgi:predicted DsbA family dithiol-disulfide isomerase